MSGPRYSVAMTESVDAELRAHLKRDDRQEDICFALYHPSTGARRLSGLIHKVLLPREGDRNVHGNVSFNSQYYDYALDEALARGMGIALLHSHPYGSDWQALSPDDRCAESGIAGGVKSATGFPLFGLTLSGANDYWSARAWEREGPRHWKNVDAECVRVAGRRLRISHHPTIRPQHQQGLATTRTVSAWGGSFQQRLVRTRVGIVGLGSVGSVVLEALARIGCGDLVIIDNDVIEEVNLDRILNAHAGYADKGLAKTALGVTSATKASTSAGFRIQPITSWLQEREAFKSALDCDVLFSCVDRPWARSILNNIAYSHLIPIIDGGIHVSRHADGRLRSADWGAFVASPGRRCLCCQRQYDPAHVAVERNGDLDDPHYIESLPEDSPLKRRENVIVFALQVGSQEVLRLIQLLGGAGDLEPPDAYRYTYPADLVALSDDECLEHCDYPAHIAEGDNGPHPGTRE